MERFMQQEEQKPVLYVVLWREEQKEVSKECASLNKNLSWSNSTTVLCYFQEETHSASKGMTKYHS